MDFHRGTFRVRGDAVELFPAYEEEKVLRIEYDEDRIARILHVDPLRGTRLKEVRDTVIFPASHYVTPEDQLERAIRGIGEELEVRLAELRAQGKPLEEERLKQRTTYDLEMISQMGFCSGIENYSRHLDGRAPGQPPHTLLDYFPKGFVTFLDESHVTVPQLNGMYNGDRSRKQTLVDFGFRLPSALDNRPLRFEEFNERVGQVIFVSATPAEYELRESGGAVVEQIIRPTGLVDPGIEVRPARTQVDDLLGEIRKTAAAGERVLVTTLTKRMAEDLTEHYEGQGVRVRYLHSDIDTMERVEILRDLRLGTFDVLVGINLLREGLDLPEVSLVAILDADKEGFLRSARSLVQTFGRAARNVSGRVILYADRETGSMREAMSETGRRRERQVAYNRENGITPETIRKMIADPIGQACEADYVTAPTEEPSFASREELAKLLRKLPEGDGAGGEKTRLRTRRGPARPPPRPREGGAVDPISTPHHKYGNVSGRQHGRRTQREGPAESPQEGGRSEVKRSRAGSSHGEPRTEPRPPRRRSRRVSPGAAAPSGFAVCMRCRIYELEH